jgi:hypothetical protein
VAWVGAQLCINYANERLQQFFLLTVLRNEQTEHEREGVQLSHIEIPDNQLTIVRADARRSHVVSWQRGCDACSGRVCAGFTREGAAWAVCNARLAVQDAEALG